MSRASVTASRIKTGQISNVAAKGAGFLFTLDAGLPENCTSAYQGWLYIPDDYGAMISLVLLAWQNGTSVTVYSAGIDGATGHCLLDAIDRIP